MQPKDKGGSCSILNDGTDGYKFAFEMPTQEAERYRAIFKQAWDDAAKGIENNVYVKAAERSLYFHEHLHAVLQYKSEIKEQFIDVDSG